LRWTVFGAAFRAVDVESYALFIPGGLAGRAREAFGPVVGRLSLAASVAERVALAALACVVAGWYLSSLIVAITPSMPSFQGHPTAEDLSALVAVALLGLVWLGERLGFAPSSESIARRMQFPVWVLLVLAVWGGITLLIGGEPLERVPMPTFAVTSDAFGWLASFVSTSLATTSTPVAVIGLFIGLAAAASAIGSGEGLAHVAPALSQPRIRLLRQAAGLIALFAAIVMAGTAFLYVMLVPATEWMVWRAVPLAGLTRHLAGPSWATGTLTVALAIAALLMLEQTTRAALGDVRGLLQHVAPREPADPAPRAVDPQIRAVIRSSDGIAAAVVVVILLGSGRVTWLAPAYAACAVGTLLIKTWALIRLRATRPGPLAFRVPFNIRLAGRERPLGLVALGLLLAFTALAMLLMGDAATTAAAIGLLGVFALLTIREGRARRQELASPTDQDTSEILSAIEVALEQVDVRPGNVLVAVRNPHLLTHLAAALQQHADRDIVVMTARLVGVDADEDDANAGTPTDAERRLFARAVALAEQHGRVVRLLIVPAHNAFDAVMAAVVRLRSTAIYVGESSVLSADDQARLLGEAWERAEKPEGLDVRVIIQHQSGGRSTYHLGAHAPALTARDLDLIHQLWLDAVKNVGPHVHHHDVVRAALTQMADELHGPNRNAALEAIRQSARPADELAAVIRTRDFSQLRDRVRNRPPGDLAALLADLSLEDQVVVFRVLPRKTAAATFEYLSLEAQEALLKAMAQEDVAAVLNNMAPDDRTMFLEELPAPVTRQLLALLTPEERSVAVALLGYPEGSIGRLMTPHYVAVREDWTVQAVLDYVRTHGQDSETLNVIYVVDEHGLLIDDIRIREFLLTPTTTRVSELMDRRFVALKATDDEQTAVAVFKKYDRSALPVTDTAGMLIGIVTIDDVLDVAEAAATKEIQRIGGSEALDEPYMRIAFARMIRKRAGWLTALFLGETLTATAMGTFEHEIERAVVLAMFVPLIISSGGNSGSQAATLVIRALALGEVGLTDWWRVIRREVAAGLALGPSSAASVSSVSPSGRRSRISTRSTGSSSQSPWACRWWASCYGARSSDRSCPSCCDVWDSTRRRPRRRSWRRSWT
jgi:magnesium transporter